jgi:hypothetical protein
MKSSALIRSTIKNGHYIAWTGVFGFEDQSVWMCSAVARHKRYNPLLFWLARPTYDDVDRTRNHIMDAIGGYAYLSSYFKFNVAEKEGLVMVDSVEVCSSWREKALKFWEDLAAKLESQGD